MEILGLGESGVAVARAVLAHTRAIGAEAASFDACDWLVVRVRWARSLVGKNTPSERYPAAGIRLIVGDWASPAEPCEVPTVAIANHSAASMKCAFTLNTSDELDYVDEATQAAIGLMEALVLPGVISLDERDLVSILSPGNIGRFGWSDSDQVPLDAIASAHVRTPLRACAALIYLRCGSNVTLGDVTNAYECSLSRLSEFCHLFVAASCPNPDTERTRAFLFLSQ